MKMSNCPLCGNEPDGVYPGADLSYRVQCLTCGYIGPELHTGERAIEEYNKDCATVVSRALAEALKDAVIMHVPAGAVWAGSKDVAPGLYALIPVKDAKP